MAAQRFDSFIPSFSVLGVVLATALFVGGCQNDNRDGSARRVIHGESFQADGERRDVDRFIDVQSAAAARIDGTLTSAHFDADGGLNSLGRRKLDLMVRDDAADAPPLVVYLDVRENSAAGSGSTRPASLARHEESVLAFLTDQGVDPQHVRLRPGPNTQYTRPAEDGLRGLRRLEGQGEAAAGPGAAGVATGSPESNLSGLYPGGSK
jgi:hypothetical protein